MRKTYETKEDRLNEQSICNHVQGNLDADMIISPSLPYSYTIDRAIIKNENIIAWLEIKVQKYNLQYTTLPYYWLGLRKANEGVQWARITNRPFFFIAKFKDMGVMATEINLESVREYPIMFGGREITQRDNDDLELILKIPVERFFRINELSDRIIGVRGLS